MKQRLIDTYLYSHSGSHSMPSDLDATRASSFVGFFNGSDSLYARSRQLGRHSLAGYSNSATLTDQLSHQVFHPVTPRSLDRCKTYTALSDPGRDAFLIETVQKYRFSVANTRDFSCVGAYVHHKLPVTLGLRRPNHAESSIFCSMINPLFP